MHQFATQCLIIAACAVASSTARGSIVMEYIVEIDQTNVVVGSTIDWTLYAQVTSDEANFGIRRAVADLTNNTGEVINAGTIAPPFADYPNQPPQVSGPGQLIGVAASTTLYNAGILEGSGVSTFKIALATGSYQVTTVGTHTLTPGSSIAGTSSYFTAASDASFNTYDEVTYSSDSVNVAATPEPSSMLLASTFLCPMLIAARRRRRERRGSAAPPAAVA